MNVKDIMIKKVLESLENGQASWVCPYRRNGLPQNGITGRRYNGFNVFFLSSLNSPSNKFYTFNQLKKLNENVTKGEKAYPVFAYFATSHTVEKEVDNEIITEDKIGFTLRYYNVFNLSQTSMWKNDILEDIKPQFDKAKEFLLNQIITSITIGTSEIPCFSPKNNEIKMPNYDSFNNMDEWLATAFHELIHATVHSLDLHKKYKLNYAKEEFVAELGASMLCQQFGILMNIENMATYIARWNVEIKKDKSIIQTCSNVAGKCIDFLLNKTLEEK